MCLVCVFDKSLYAKTSEVTWKHQHTFSPIVLRMGVHHTINMYNAGDNGESSVSVMPG